MSTSGRKLDTAPARPARGAVEVSSILSSHVNHIIKCKVQGDELTILHNNVHQIVSSIKGEIMVDNPGVAALKISLGNKKALLPDF